jgi:lipoprotein-anchoring transpeptidase ErfK/SrfK
MRRICMSALAPVLLAGAFPGSAFAQVTYVPYSGQPAYAVQPPAQQQYNVYMPQQGYAPQQGYTQQQSYMPRQGYMTRQSYMPQQKYAAAAPVATTQTYAAPAQQSYPAPVPPPAPAAESRSGFLAGIFGGPTIQAHVYQPFAPQYQTPATQPTVINPAPAAYTPSSQGDMANYPIDPRYLRQEVMYPTDEQAGTIVVDTPNKFLYLVGDNGKALRYGIGVGRPGFTWSGTHMITAKREWPDWYPPAEMLQRRPDLPRYMPGGMDNPLGARAMYLGSTLYRIHGSNEPWTIGTNVSSGCIRMRNADVEDLYGRVKVGTKVVVI